MATRTSAKEKFVRSVTIFPGLNGSRALIYRDTEVGRELAGHLGERQWVAALYGAVREFAKLSNALFSSIVNTIGDAFLLMPIISFPKTTTYLPDKTLVLITFSFSLFSPF